MAKSKQNNLKDRFRRYFDISHKKKNNIWIILICGAIAVTIYFFVIDAIGDSYSLKISAGSIKGRRHEIAMLLADEANNKKIDLEIIETKGSDEAQSMVASGALDLALIQGGLAPMNGVNQIAALYIEPLHLLVKKGLALKSITKLKGKKINLSTKGSGTHHLSSELLKYIGFREGDFIETNLSYSDIDNITRTTLADSLPDAFFMVSSLPSKQVYYLINECGYALKELPYAEVFSMHHFFVQKAIIPTYSYSVFPAHPDKEIETIGTQLLLIANKKTPKQAIKSILETIYSGDFARRIKVNTLDAEKFTKILEYPLHEGAIEFRDRYQPAITSQTIESIESFRSFVFSLGIAIFLFWRWYVSNHGLGLEIYIAKLRRIEKNILRLEADNDLNLKELKKLNAQLGQIKADTMEKVIEKKIKNVELLSSFLSDVTDLRNIINSKMILIQTK